MKTPTSHSTRMEEAIQLTEELANETGNLWLFVFGTLRPGDYNYNRSGLTLSGEPVRNVSLPGFQMFNLNSTNRPIYPIVKSTGVETDVIIGDMLRVNKDDPALEGIHRMEIGAGYEAITRTVCVPVDDTIDNPGVGIHADVLLYEYVRFKGDEFPITSGDWFQFTKENGR